MKTFVTILLAGILFSSCKKDKINESTTVQPCTTLQVLDSTTIHTRLIGSWLWRKQACMLVPMHDADKEVRVTFNTNNSFSVLENSVVVAQGTWSLKAEPFNKWTLNFSPYSSYLAGIVNFCDINQVEFDERYIDGCVHIFTRVN